MSNKGQKYKPLNIELFCQSTMSRSIITGMLNHCTVTIGQKD